MKLEITKAQFRALVDVLESAQAVFEEIPEEQKNFKLIKRMFNKNGCTNVLKNL